MILVAVRSTHGLVLLVPAGGIVLFLVVRSRKRSQAMSRAIAQHEARLQMAQYLDALRSLSPRDFEVAMATLLSESGFTQVQVVGGAGDLSVDIRGLNPSGGPFVAQRKRYAAGRNVSSLDVQTFIGMAHRYHEVGHLLYFTTSDYTANAKALAGSQRIDLFNGERIVGWANNLAAQRQAQAAATCPPQATSYDAPPPTVVPPLPPEGHWDQQHWQVCTVCRTSKTRWRDPSGQAVCEKCANASSSGPVTG